MPTIDDESPRAHAHAPAGAPARTGTARLVAAWPFLALAALVLLAGVRLADDHDSSSAPLRASIPVSERRFGDARLDVPTAWVTLDRSADHVTWGDPERAHTVTLAHVEASALPLPGVVQEMTDQSRDAIPGAKLVEEPRQLELTQPASRGDSAMLTRFRVDGTGAAPIELAQVWRRDSRAGIDLVATWTSGDGRWVVRPRDGIPRADASG